MYNYERKKRLGVKCFALHAHACEGSVSAKEFLSSGSCNEGMV